MALWHCWDRISGERWEERCSSEDLPAAVVAYIVEGIDADTGAVDYDVLATAADGSEHVISGTDRERVQCHECDAWHDAGENCRECGGC
jgi:hypothetical protein